MPDEPLSRDQARAKLNWCLEEASVIYTKHFRDEMIEDNLVTEDVLAVCRSGTIITPAEQDIKTGNWKYRIEGITTDGPRAAIVFTFRPDMAVLITVFKRT